MSDVPMMPGLSGDQADPEDTTPMGGEGGAAGGDLASLLEEADEADMAELVTAAGEAYLNGDLDELMGAPAPAPDDEIPSSEGGEKPKKEGEEGEEGKDPEAPDFAAAETEAARMVEEIAQMQTELTDLVAKADESDEGDSKALETQLDIVTEAYDEAEDAKGAVEKAIDAEDELGVQTATASLQGAYGKAQAACEHAKKTAKGQVQAAADAKAETEPEKSSLAAWAENY